MSENLSADPSAIRAHAMRLSSYQGDLEQASDALRAAAASRGAFGMMVGPIIAPFSSSSRPVSTSRSAEQASPWTSSRSP